MLVTESIVQIYLHHASLKQNLFQFYLVVAFFSYDLHVNYGITNNVDILFSKKIKNVFYKQQIKNHI